MKSKRAIGSLLTLLLLAVAFLPFSSCARKKGPPPGVVVRFLAYTNAPATNTRFALLSIHNDNPFPIRWRGNWSEVEGQFPYKAPTFSPRLPWFTSSLDLPKSESLLLAVGEPLEIVTKERERWRFSVQWSRYTPRQRLFDLGLKHPWLMNIPRFSQLNDPHALDPTKMVISSSAWLGR